MRNIIITVLVIVVLGLIVYAVASWTDTQDAENQNTDENTVEDQSPDAVTEGDGSGVVPAGYSLYENTDLELSIFVPVEATISEISDERIEITLLGPDNEPNTEITDGFYMTVFHDDLTQQYDSALTYAEEVIEEKRSAEENQITSELEQRTIGDMTAYRYSFTGALGSELTEYVFISDDSDAGFQLTYSIADPNDRGYENIVFAMLEGLDIRGDGAIDPPIYEAVSLAMLDYSEIGGQYTQESNGPERGCDRVVMTDRTITPTVAPLTAALEELFALETDTYGGWQNFMNQTNETLSFDRAEVNDSGLATIYLSGELSGLSGVCDNPRAKIQIEETALQFGSVSDVRIILNDEETDLTPDGSGLDG